MASSLAQCCYFLYFAATASVAAAFLLGLAALAKILYAKCSGKLSVMEPLRMVSTAGQGFGQDPKKKEELVPDPCKDVDEVVCLEPHIHYVTRPPRKNLKATRSPDN